MSPLAHISRTSRTPQRQIPLFRPMASVFGPSATDCLIGDYRRARDAVEGFKMLDAEARANLGRANSHNPKWRRKSQADAMSALNRLRAGMRANYRALAVAASALLALGVELGAL